MLVVVVVTMENRIWLNDDDDDDERLTKAGSRAGHQPGPRWPRGRTRRYSRCPGRHTEMPHTSMSAAKLPAHDWVRGLLCPLHNHPYSPILSVASEMAEARDWKGSIDDGKG